MPVDLILDRIELSAAVALTMAGVVAAWTSQNIAKRVVGGVIALSGAMLALAVLHMPDQMLMAGVGVAFATTVAGAALLVRSQESYGVIETPALDLADADNDTPEPRA